jgi:putative transposase
VVFVGAVSGIRGHWTARPLWAGTLQISIAPTCAALPQPGVLIGPSPYHEWVAKTPTRRRVRDVEVADIISAEGYARKNSRFVRRWYYASSRSGSRG